MAHARDDGRGCGGLARFHAGASQSDDGHAMRVERCIEIQLPIAGASRYADALAQIGEVQHHTKHAAVEGLALVRVGGVANTEHAADIQHLDHIARLDRLGHVARVAEQRLTRAQCTDNDVALDHFGHAAAGQLEGVVRGFVGEDFHHHDHAFLGRDFIRDAQFVRQSAGLRDGCDLIDDDGSHFFACSAAFWPARWWNTPVRATILEKPSASVGDHSPTASPYTPLDAFISE